MLFNSIHYLLFLPIVVGLYYVLPHRFRWVLLFAASCIFYMDFFPPYLLILFAIILVDYVCGLLIEKSKNRWRFFFLSLSIAGNIGILVFFKYYNFFVHILHVLSDFTGSGISFQAHDIILPIGLSFHAFQSLSYTIEVYRGKQQAERHLGYFANYVLFFPQMVAGPIERYERLGRQLREKHPYQYENIAKGFRLVLYGLFIKMCIADNLAPLVDAVYRQPANYSAFSVAMAVLAFSIQIYADFYGYSVVALGSARMMGIELMDNFKQPYFATGIRNFWQRWHISLGGWFRDYVFIPAGGNRVGVFRLFANIMLVFTLSGLWHGANYTFIAWGALHGFLYITEVLVSKIPGWAILSERAVIRFFLSLKTFLLVSLIWILFRAENFTKVKAMFHALFNTGDEKLLTPAFAPRLFLPLVIFFVLEIATARSRMDNWLEARQPVFRWGFYFIAMMCLLLFSGIKTYPFIYFRF